MPRHKQHVDSSDQVIVEGHLYMVKRNDKIVKAEILQSRFNDQTKTQEYYVHYLNLNRRLDEWIPAKRVQAQEWCSSYENGDGSSAAHGRAHRKKNTEDPVEITECAETDAVPTGAIDDLEKEHVQITRIKYIQCIQFGIYEIDTWYFSPYPDEYGYQYKLFICEFCLKYMKLEKTYRYHLGECTRRQPPGKEIYKKGTLSIYETDPLKAEVYCQNLCLLAKLFIDHKTIFYKLEEFLFYILCEVDKHGSHIVAYFSKERDSPDGHNVACILTLPPFQKQGYGKLLIAFSYELCKLDRVVGTPEKPLSDLGMISYRSYWSWVLLDVLKEFRGAISIHDLSEMTSITNEDIISTLESMKMLKYWVGIDGFIAVTPRFVEEYISSAKFKRPRLTVDKYSINWTPPNKGATVKEESRDTMDCCVSLTSGASPRHQSNSVHHLNHQNGRGTADDRSGTESDNS